MTTNPTKLWSLAHLLLDTIVDAYTTDGIDPPERHEVTAAEPVGECDKLVVAFNRVFIGVPGFAETPVPVTRALTRVATFTIVAFRCLTAVPQGEAQELLEAPTVEDLDNDAQVVMTDAFVLHRGLSRAHLAGAFTGYCGQISLGPAEPLVPEGGIGGTTMTLVSELS